MENKRKEDYYAFDVSFQEFVESEEFERLEADVMSVVHMAFKRGYQLGLATPAPQLVGADTEPGRETLTDHLALWAQEDGGKKLAGALRKMNLADLTGEFRSLFHGMSEENYDSGLLDTYLNVLDEKDPMPPMRSPEDSFIRLMHRGVRKGLLTQREAFELWLRYDNV